ncbi:MAG: NADH-quinone oxidoreductase subunit I [Candidatus Dactylopiibacterium carminicum]|uniref:NADH-quinone oxidoreductase subunit I n=1 Tax=Candidatus Dactylopiibacterium carminicum TaxID=857335 RepID=A0A272ESY2_9RHOO|nr:hydrogen gas-evolving membrane-bound hydrogenase subunit E [Candidatus Dactylopiibacterium carminicum]KAF7598974.1 NADH-quinone oxidoreductase subunit I [Candidatus Dactylopiibacterium carminicum]PAS92840.1 MAG: NADH-quinone oxidoreductase subunit I [Candidatus Dactylopiibacterium carminicum]PAS98985.1 MAG: NADH dehydrogenase [Candidatus Dactylopiibacterium carminicum]
MLTGILGILAAMLVAPLLAKRLDQRAAWLLALAPLAAFLWFVAQVPQIASGVPLRESLAWVPALGVSLSFSLDGLSLLFALLISGIGTLIVLYAGSYLSDHHQLGRFYAYLLGFMAAMLGVVLADDLIGMFVFWELTSITSFLLISFQHEKPESRRAALQALLITGGDGLALLAGLILLGDTGGSWSFSTLDSQTIQASPVFPAIAVLILLGCFTKSAQFPFHIWLPNAMNAPTPVSAYLHSATMVKAGIYLLARLNPIFGGGGGWDGALMLFGAGTALLGAILAFRQTDLKRMLAYTTVTVPGQLTMLLGTNTSYGLQAFAIYLLAHSLYKGALFMAVGSIDHATGTRETGYLGGLIRFMPLTGAAVALAAFSNAGLPPFFGFIAKEFQYAGLIELGPLGWAITAVMTITNALLLTVAGIVFLRTFLGKQGRYPKTPHEVGVAMWLGPMLLALAGFALGVLSDFPEVWLIDAAVQAISYGPVAVRLYLWGGLTPAVVTSLLTVTLGVLFYLNSHRVRNALNLARALWHIKGDRLWDNLLHGIFRLAAWLATPFQHGSLQRHLALLVGVASVISLAIAAPLALHGLRDMQTSPILPPSLGSCLLTLAGALGVCFLRERIAQIAALSLSGLGLGLFFLTVNAPDVAITQIMVETLSVVFIALVLRRLPRSRRQPDTATRRALRLGIAALFGLAIAAVMLASLGRPLQGDIAEWFTAHSLPLGHGANVVNVILVDFRAFDTLGEILVVTLAALAAAPMLGSGLRPGGTAQRGFESVLLQQTLKPFAVLMLLIALLLLWRGHNLPGGGFIGALVAACGVLLVALGFGSRAAKGVLRAEPATLSGLGLALAAGAGVIGLLRGQPFLSGSWIAPGGVPLGSPLLFDVGVLLAVFGAVMHMLLRLLDEKEA